MDGQMTIWDWLKPDYPDFKSISHDETVRIISEATGIPFKFRDSFWGWQAKIGRVRFDLEFDTYSGTDRPFIGCSYDIGIGGGGAPCDDIQEAVNWFTVRKERYVQKRKERSKNATNRHSHEPKELEL